uniref:C-type lectin domain-containing protein n=1 Tax=Neogobius melanostomus TaxID=47308 RepID=A0A8C6STK0_9GOBI
MLCPSSSVHSLPPCVVQCNAGWALNRRKCYYFSANNFRLNWTNSRDMCGSLSADLVKMESREEQVLTNDHRPVVKETNLRFSTCVFRNLCSIN